MREALMLYAAIACCALPGMLAAQENTAKLPPGYQPAATDKAAAMAKLCQATADTGLFSGAVLVASRGEVIYKAGFGNANHEWDIANTPATKFRLASVSKQFCAVIVLQLVQEGKLKLDNKITDHLPYYRSDTGDRITLHHLLSHQSGIKDFTASYDYRGKIARMSFGKDEFIKLHCSGDLSHDPGAIYSYCNAGYCILGRIIEKVTRKSFQQNLQQRIFDPLGMKDSGYDSNQKIIKNRANGYDYGAFGLENAEYIEIGTSPGAAGGLYSTVEDMYRWDRALYTDKLLNKKYRDLMFTPNRGVPEVKAAGGRPHSIYGYGWQIYTRRHPVTQKRVKVINHGGAINGFRAMEHRLVDEDAFIIVLCNQGDRFGQSEVWNAVVRLSGELLHIVTGQPYRLPGKPRRTQDQRLFEMVQKQGVEAAIDWFKSNGKKAPWGGALLPVANQLIKTGRTADGLRMMEYEAESTPGKVWLLRKTSQAHLDYGDPRKALDYANQGLKLRPDDEAFQNIKLEAEHTTGKKQPM